MLWNYFKIGYRSLLKHKKSSLINLVGLGIAFSTCLIIFTFMDRVYNMDALHPHSERTFLIESVREDNGMERIFGNVPFALSATIKEDIPEVEDAIRIQYSSADFRYQDKVFNEQIIFADEGYFNTFSFTFLSGSKNVLKEKDRVVLSKNIAKKYFGDEEALGKQVSILFSANGKEYRETYIVGAVADEFDYMTTIRFNIILPFQCRKNLGFMDDGNWKGHSDATFVTLKGADQRQHVNDQINSYTKIQNEANPDRIIKHFLLDPLPDYSLNATGKEEMLSYNAPMVARVLLSVIAAFILLLAVFNYINISVVSATSILVNASREFIGFSSFIMVCIARCSTL
jgi:putative ABC transport system permease protein